MLSSATMMNPPMPSGTMTPPEPPRMSSILLRSPELQRMCPPRRIGQHRACHLSSSERGFQQAFDLTMREHHRRLSLQRLVVTSRERLAGFGGHEQAIDMVEQRASVGLSRDAVGPGHVVDSQDKLRQLPQPLKPGIVDDQLQENAGRWNVTAIHFIGDARIVEERFVQREQTSAQLS